MDGSAPPVAHGDAASTLPLTGERTVPGVPDEAYWFARHLVAYEHAAAVVGTTGAGTVLDAGCGEGYGLPMLRDAGAGRVVGVDLDRPTVAHAHARYATGPGAAGGTVEVVECELMALPLADDEVDVTVSFQVIEHVHDVPGYLASLVRVTRPRGRVLIATPNRLTFTPDGDTPVNPFHHIEFAPDELRTTLTRAGLVVDELLGVHHGERIAGWERAHDLALTTAITAAPPTAWEDDLRATVHATTTADFVLHEQSLRTSLDLLAVCSVPPGRGRPPA